MKLQKKDAKTGKFVTLSNATFELYKYNEEIRKYEQMKCKVGNTYFENWTTNENGFVNTQTKLPAGKYQLKEIKIPNGFIELEQELFFNVDNRNKTLEYDSDWDAWITVTAENLQPTGTLKINKTVDLRDNVDLSLINDIDFTKIKFELKASENIIDYADGTIIYNKGAIVGQYNLDTEGKLTITNLPMGKYKLKEISTINGAILDNEEYDVIFEKSDNITKEYIIELNIENKTTLTEISKKTITGTDELEGATLTVLDENNDIIDTWVSSNIPHSIEGLIVGKTYTLREDLTPVGYVKSTDIQFKPENISESQKIVMIDKVVEMTKTNIGGKEIEGAKLIVYDKNGEIVDKWVSTKEAHKINNLIEGETYILHEEYAPDNYVIATDTEFTVTNDKETQRVNLIDKIVLISKTDLVNGNELPGAELTVTDKERKYY